MAFPDVFLGSLAALIATSLGASAVLLFRNVSGRVRSALLAFAAGMMAFSAVEMLLSAHKVSGDFTVAAGVFVGVLVLVAMDKLIPHVHSHVSGNELTKSKKKALLVTGAISIHNVPEGFAIASAFAGSTPLGWLVALSIALQDIPEGLLVSAPLASYGVKTRKSIFFGVLSGVVEFAAALAGFVFLSFFTGLAPWALSFSAGAMVYVILAELLPDALHGGMERVAAVSFASGAILAFGVASLLVF